MKKIILSGSLALFVVPLAAFGQEPGRADFEIAQDAVAKGDILPLADILRQVQISHPGRVIQVGIGESDGLIVYKVELVTADGRLIELELDAATGAIVDVDEDRGGDRAEDDRDDREEGDTVDRDEDDRSDRDEDDRGDRDAGDND